jgi:predicted HNH restriction endonuclease
VKPTEIERDVFNELFSLAQEYVADEDYGFDSEFPEGKEIERKHRLRERNQAVIKSAKEAFKQKNGKLYCQVCGFDFQTKYGDIGSDFIEGHHTVPISELKGEVKTKVKDVALVCSNCHRMLHRRRPWLKMDELRNLISKKA